MALTVPISDRGRDLLGKLVERTGATMTEVLDAALESYRRQCFLEEAEQAYTALAEEPAAYAEYKKELAFLEGTIDDGLKNLPA